MVEGPLKTLMVIISILLAAVCIACVTSAPSRETGTALAKTRLMDGKTGDFTSYTAFYSDSNDASLVNPDPLKSIDLYHVKKGGSEYLAFRFQAMSGTGPFELKKASIVVDGEETGLLLFDAVNSAAGLFVHRSFAKIDKALYMKIMDAGRVVFNFLFQNDLSQSVEIPFAGKRAMKFSMDTEFPN